MFLHTRFYEFHARRSIKHNWCSLLPGECVCVSVREIFFFSFFLFLYSYLFCYSDGLTTPSNLINFLCDFIYGFSTGVYPSFLASFSLSQFIYCAGSGICVIRILYALRLSLAFLVCRRSFTFLFLLIFFGEERTTHNKI